MSNSAGRAASGIYRWPRTKRNLIFDKLRWPACRKLWLAICPELTDTFEYIYIHMYIYKITYCGLLAVKPGMDMIEQMVGVQCYHNIKMRYTTRSPILLVEVK